jgi:molybdopterin converting factor small subunit
MPYLAQPNSDLQRIVFLRTCLGMAKKAEEAGAAILSKKLVTHAETSLTDFTTSHQLLDASLSARQKEVLEKNESVDVLMVYVRDFFDGLKRRTYRLHHPTSVLRLYGVSSEGDLPKLSGDNNLMEAARQIVLGDANAVAEGYVAMSNPTATEVQEKLTIAEKEKAEVGPADSEYNRVQKELDAKREPIDELISEIADTIQFVMRKESASNVRRVMRNYGFTYRYLKDEQPDEEVVVESEQE